MRTFIIFLLSCASLTAAEDDAIRVVTTTKTNTQSGAVTTIDVVTRAGQTNLVRHTKTKAGAVQIRIHRFYRDGALVGDFVATPDSSGFTMEAGSPHTVSFEFDATRHAKSAVIASRDGVILDAFTCSKGVFSPAPISSLRFIRLWLSSDSLGHSPHRETDA